MTTFIDEKIEVEHEHSPPQPVRFTWRGQMYEVAEIVQEWVDTGFGSLTGASRTWYNRRHRRYYVVRTTAGDVFKLYFDYSRRSQATWWLVSCDRTSQ